MKILEILNKSADFLEQKGIENSRREAEIFVCSVMGCNRVDIYASFDMTMNENEKEVLRTYLRRRVSGEPLQYITGNQQFRFISLKVKPGVFIPRQETEMLVQLVLDYLKSRESRVESQEQSQEPKAKSQEKSEEEANFQDDKPVIQTTNDNQKPTILEIGTGTGAIALSIAKEAGLKVTAVDVSDKALNLAKENAVALGLEDKAVFKKSNIFSNVSPGRFDIIVSNPPYIPVEERNSLPQEVKKEPEAALYGGKEGMKVILKILEEAPGYLNEGGALILEMAHSHAEAVKEEAQNKGYSNIEVIDDLAGKKRFLRCFNAAAKNN